VTITGGEPTLSRNIDSFIEKIKELNLAVKLDSNGLQPHVLERLIKKNLLDYAAIDIKTSPEKYPCVTNSDADFRRIIESFDIVRASGSITRRAPPVSRHTSRWRTSRASGMRSDAETVLSAAIPAGREASGQELEVIEPYPTEILRRFRDFILTFADRCEIRGI